MLKIFNQIFLLSLLSTLGVQTMASYNVEQFADDCKESPLHRSKVLIVGGGLSGLAIAKCLENNGFKHIDLVEKRPTYLDEGAGIALPANATWALEHLSIDFKSHVHLVTNMIFTDDKRQILCNEDITHIHPAGAQFYATDRSSLHKILLNTVSSTYIKMNTTVTAFIENEHNIIASFSDGTKCCYDLLIAADGAHSSLRKLCDGDVPLMPLNIHAWRTIVQTPQDLDHPTYMLGKNSIFLLYPLKNNQTYIYAHRVEENENPDHQTTAINDLEETFKDFAGDVPNVLQQIKQNQKLLSHYMYTSSIKWRYGKRILFVGDAAHTFSPMLQNGGAQAFEDAYVLGKLLQTSTDWERCLSEFVTRRDARVTWVKTVSDQKIVALSQEQASIRNDKIRQEGAPNVKGFKLLMKTSP